MSVGTGVERSLFPEFNVPKTKGLYPADFKTSPTKYETDVFPLVPLIPMT